MGKRVEAADINPAKLEYEYGDNGRVVWRHGGKPVLDIDLTAKEWQQRLVALASKGLHHAMRDGRGAVKDPVEAVRIAKGIAEHIRANGLVPKRRKGSSLLAKALVYVGHCKDLAEAGELLEGTTPAKRRKLAGHPKVAKAMLKIRESMIPDDDGGESIDDIL